MKQTSPFIAGILVAASLVSCAKPASNSGPAPLPQSWIQPEPATSLGAPIGAPVAPPSTETVSLVDDSFKVHTNALERSLKASSEIVKGSEKSGPLLASKPTPIGWHLDGMIATFAIDVGGFFGTLVSDAAPSVKVTWQRQEDKAAPIAVKSAKSKIKVSSRMSKAELSTALAPAISAAQKTHSVSNIGNFKKNLSEEGLKFLTMTRVLSTVGASSGWHVAGYQLQLTFNASGDITPELGVGGGMTLIFDWETDGAEVRIPQLTTKEVELKSTMLPFVTSMSSMIAVAKSESKSLRKSGFELGVFQIGIGMGAGGDIGVASVQGLVIGRIIFKKDEEKSLMTYAAPKALLLQKSAIKILAPPKNKGLFAQTLGTDSPEESEVKLEKFTDSIGKSIEMATFFAERAKHAETPNFKCIEIEAGFDAAVTGDLVFATVSGYGVLRMGFERVGL